MERKNDMNFEYYYGHEAEQFTFYRIPKLLIKDKRFSGISSDAKMLYGLMLDRMQLSVKNGWIDEVNRVYIIYTVEQIMEDLCCCKEKAIKILSELNGQKGIGLIEKIRRGLGKPDIIYVKNFVIQDDEMDENDSDLHDSHSEEQEISTLRSTESRLAEVSNSDFQKSEKPTSRSMDNRPVEVGETDPINNYINKTDMNNNNQSETYPEIISTTTEEKLVEEDVDEDFVVVRNLLRPLGVDEKGVRAILRVAGNDVRKCKAAVNLLKAQKSRISNVTGWIIKAIRDEYEMNSYGGAIVQSGNTSGVLLKADSHEELRLIEQLYLAQVPRSDSVA